MAIKDNSVINAKPLFNLAQLKSAGVKSNSLGVNPSGSVLPNVNLVSTASPVKADNPINNIVAPKTTLATKFQTTNQNLDSSRLNNVPGQSIYSTNTPEQIKAAQGGSSSPVVNPNSGNSSGYTRDASGNVFGPDGVRVTYDSLPKGPDGKPLMNLETLPLKSGTVSNTNTNTNTDTSSQYKTDVSGGITPTYGGIIGALLNQKNEEYKAQQAEANRYNNLLTQSRLAQAGDIAGNANRAVDQQFGEGRANIINTRYAQEQAGLGAGFQGASTLMGAANTQQQIQQAGLTSAAGFAAPQLSQYGQAYYNPMNPQGSANGGGVSPSDPFYATLQSYADMAVNGQMSGIPASITSNPVLNAQMLQMAKAKNPNFNINTAQASGDIQAKSQAIDASAVSTNQALDMLTQAYSQLPAINKSNVPMWNKFMAGLSDWTGYGAPEMANFKSRLGEARAQLSATINSATNIGVDMGGMTATNLLPDNMTPDQVPKQVADAKDFIAQRIAAFKNAGNQLNTNTNTGGGTGGLYDY